MNAKLPFESIEDSYDLQIKSIEPVKSSYRLETDRGKKRLGIWNDYEALMKASGLRDQLAHNGYRTLDRFIRTVSGKPYLEHENEYIILTDWIEGLIPSITNEEQVKKTTQHIARLHLALSNMNVDMDWEPWSNQFGRGLQHFHLIKDKITSKNKISAFDEMIIADIQSHLEQVNQSILMATKIEKNNFHSGRAPQYCHGNLQLKNFRIDQYREPWLIHFGIPVYDTPAYDLAKYLVQLYIKSNYKEEVVFSTLDTYQETIPLQKEEKLWILTYISYPHHLWKYLYVLYLSSFPQPRIADDQQYIQQIELKKQLERLYRSLYQYFRL